MLEQLTNKKIVRVTFNLDKNDLLDNFNEGVALNAIHNIFSLPQIYDVEAQSVVVSTFTLEEESTSILYPKYSDYSLFVLTFYQT